MCRRTQALNHRDLSPVLAPCYRQALHWVPHLGPGEASVGWSLTPVPPPLEQVCLISHLSAFASLIALRSPLIPALSPSWTIREFGFLLFTKVLWSLAVGKAFYRRYAVCAVGFFVLFRLFVLLNRKDIHCGSTCLLEGNPFVPFVVGNLVCLEDAHSLFGICWPEVYSFVVGKLFARGNVCTKGMLICCLELVDRKDIPSLLRNHSLWETCLPEVYSFIGGNLLTGSVPFVVENLFTRRMKYTHSLQKTHSVCEACFPEVYSFTVGNFLIGSMRLLLCEKPVY